MALFMDFGTSLSKYLNVTYFTNNDNIENSVYEEIFDHQHSTTLHLSDGYEKF